MTRQEKDNQSGPDKSRPVITVDYDLYAHHFENSGLSEDEKREYLKSLWNLIVEVISLGYGVHPVQQAQNACGKLLETPANPPILSANAVEWLDQNKADVFNGAADGNAPEAAERIPK